MTTVVKLVLLALLAWVVACSSDPRQHALDDYLKRLSRALQQESSGQPQPLLLAFPARRQLLASAPATDSIALLDFLGMSDCQLQQTLAQRNSSLGKLGSESQRLLQDLAFIQQAPACIELLQQQRKDELAQQLLLARENRQSQLAALIWQATLGAREFGLFWQASPLPGDYPSRTGPELIAALESLQRLSTDWLGGNYGDDYAQSSSTLEAALATIRGGDGGLLHRSLALQAIYLEQANVMAQRRLQRQPLCYPGRPNPQGDILFNVVQKFWLQGLQGWSAQLSQRYYQLWPALQSLEATLAPGEPQSYQQWRQQRDRQMEQLVSAPRRHVAAIRPLLAQCGLAPGQDKDNA
jgi:hypothetical protein